jgi:hypothetical protein
MMQLGRLGAINDSDKWDRLKLSLSLSRREGKVGDRKKFEKEYGGVDWWC